MGRLLGLGAVLLVLPVTTAIAQTTVERQIVPAGAEGGFRFLTYGPGQPYVVREDLAAAQQDRGRRRRSLAYFAQLSDFQLSDEESPARVEFLDQLHPSLSSAWRPQEALLAHTVDASIRQVNANLVSPVTHKRKKRSDLQFVVVTGDNADSQQRNESQWVAQLLQGGTVHPNSGRDDGPCPGVAAGEGARYTGVQDYDDYTESGHFYDPDVPAGQYAAWPAWPGLMDRAQEPFRAAGLDVPSYVALGNHDGLVQGNEDAIAPYEAVATGCVKPMHAAISQSNLSTILSDTLVETSPDKTIQVPRDPDRAYVTKPEYRGLFDAGQSDAHGFDYIDGDELEASNGAASYYDFSPVAGLRFIALDTVANGGVTGITDRGNVDDSQFQWLMRTVAEAERNDELVVIYSHHAPASMDADVPDEAAGPCLFPDAPENDPNPGCDLDPRSSSPLHLGDELIEELKQHPHVVAWIAGHSHTNDVAVHKGDRGGFWVIRTSAEADWPHQDRLIEIMDNRDGTLSLFGTLIDNAAPATAPPPGTPAAGMSVDTLASIARTIGFNDPHADDGAGGQAADRNVELLVPDPRRADAAAESSVTVSPARMRRGRLTRLRIRASRNGRPARNTVVQVGARRVRTDGRGRATVRVRFRRLGSYQVRAGRANATILVTRRG